VIAIAVALLAAATACGRSNSKPTTAIAPVAVNIPAIPTQAAPADVAPVTAAFELIVEGPKPPRVRGSEPPYDPDTQDVMVIGSVALRNTRWTPVRSLFSEVDWMRRRPARRAKSRSGGFRVTAKTPRRSHDARR